jgi:uncharacterized membrane protein YecN with MAPEG domain
LVPQIVPAYAALLALFFVYLSARVIRVRQTAGMPIGSGGNRLFERRIRVHANFAEYVPLALILLMLMEIRGNAGWYLHLLCLALLVARAAHAWGVSQEPDDFRFRGLGVMLTFAVLIAAAITLLVGVI